MVTLVNRAKMTIVSTGTGPLTLGSAVNGYQSFAAAGVSTGDVVRYIIEDGDAWEIGLGTYSANTSSLSRSVSESSHAGAPIALSGKAVVFLGLSAADINARVESTDPRLSNAREWSAGTISQTEAEAGTATTRRAFTAQRVRQSVLGWWSGSADKTKLDGIAASAQVNIATNLGYTSAVSAGTLTSSTGTNATLPAATTAVAGLLTSADKTKLNGIAAGAQVNVATNLGITGTGNSRTITSSTGTNVTIPVATSSTAGLMATGDKSKLDGIAAGAQVNVATNLGITGTGNSRTITSSTGSNVTIPVATSSTAGLMATGDKAKLDGIAAGAQVNVATNLGVAGGTTGGPTITSSTGSNATLPTASTTASGVVTTGAQSWAGAKTFTGVITAPDFVTTSDARLKQDIREITDALDKLRSLQGITYQIADDPRRRIGLLAQDVQRVAPEAVLETNGILRLSYGNLVGLLVEAIKDLSLEVDQLKRTQT